MKTKKIFLCALACFVFFLTGCEKETKTTTGASSVTVRLLTEAGGIDDKSFNAAAWRGILSYYGDSWNATPSRGSSYDVIAAENDSLFVPNLKMAADEGWDLIIVTGFKWAAALSEVAPLYPDQKFAIIDVDWVNEPNVRQYYFREEQGSYLVGVIAAEQAKEDGVQDAKFGFLGGVPGATITKFEMGYIQGIKSILPEAKIFDYYANSWSAPELGKAQAKNWYDNGVYCIFSAAAATGNGMISQSKECRLSGKNVWAIGVDSDQYEDGLYGDNESSVLTSMLKLCETAAFDALTSIEDDMWEAKVVTMGFENNGIGYSTKNAAIKPSAALAAEKAKAAILTGEIVVHKTYKDTRDAGIAPAGLGALDD